MQPDEVVDDVLVVLGQGGVGQVALVVRPAVQLQRQLGDLEGRRGLPDEVGVRSVVDRRRFPVEGERPERVVLASLGRGGAEVAQHHEVLLVETEQVGSEGLMRDVT